MSASAVVEPLAGGERPVASRAFLATSLGAGLLAAWVIPGSAGPGIGIPLVAVAVALAVVVGDPTGLTPWSLWLGATALALAGVAAVVAAPWVVLLDLAAALGLGALASSEGRAWPEFVRAIVALIVRTFEVPAFVARGLLPPGRLRGRLSPVLRGVAVGGLLVVVFGGLFVSADRAFAHLARRILLPAWDLLPIRVLVLGGTIGVAGVLSLIRPRLAPTSGRAPHEIGGEPVRRGFGRTEWTVALGLVDLLFVAFVVVQLAFLFGGHHLVQRTVGLTYAEYARQGFFQLLAAAALTLGLVAASWRWTGDTHRGRLRALLGLLCVLTLLVLASALRRLGLYEEAFGLTRARFAAQAAVLWLGALFVLVLAAGALRRAPWLPRTAVAMSAALLLVFSLASPDAIVARRNIDRYLATGRLDAGYLASLGADAVPAIAGLSRSPTRDDLLERLRCALPPREAWSDWNLGRARARDSLAAAGVAATCATATFPAPEPAL